MSDYETILIEREGRVARVSFNRPDKLNSFNGTLRREFVRAAQEVNADDDIWVVVLTGAGRALVLAQISPTRQSPRPMVERGLRISSMLNSNPACWPFTMPENPGSPRLTDHVRGSLIPMRWPAT